jgi:signal transduction histidine kinase
LRIENQTLQLHKQRINLNDVISLVIQDIQRLRQGVITEANVDGKASKTKAISLSYKSSTITGKEQQYDNKNNSLAASIVVEIDRERIMQVLSNLLENAIKFTNENGTISVIVEVQKNQNNKKEEIIISIKDNGTGIDPEIIPRLFTKFCTKSSSVLETTGTGLGLYISKSIIEAHGGAIWAQNNAQDTGATFSFSLPV